MATLVGTVQWHNLMNRPLFSCLHCLYQFVLREDQDELFIVESDVLAELILNVALLTLWMADLCKPWLPILPTSDASTEFGFGMCIARCHPTLTRHIAAHAEDDSHFRLQLETQDPVEQPRAGKECRIPLTQSCFKPIFAIRAKEILHSGEMEAIAVVLSLRRLARSTRLHSHRGASLVDAIAVKAAMQKGRSSAGTLRHHVMAAGAIILACDWRFRFGYLPSESNPSDWPSRGKRRPAAVRSKFTKSQRPTKSEKYIYELRTSLRHLSKGRYGGDLVKPSTSGGASTAGHCGSMF